MKTAVASPTVSVVIPTYERREYVRRAVASVLAQTFADFELIVVDDGSTDGTDLALHDVDPRLRYHRQENRGSAAARNAGIALARGEVVTFLDSDNRWRPNHLAVVTEALARFPEAVLVTTCPGFLARGRTPVRRAEVVDMLPAVLLMNAVGWTSCTAVRAAVLREIGGFDERLPVFEDSDLWIRLAMRGPFCLLPSRTIVHQSTSGGLKQRGVRAGRYPAAIRLSLAAARDRLPGLGRPDLDDLEARIEAKELLVDCLIAFAASDREAGRRLLARACRRAPDLSRRPEIVIATLRLLPVPRNQLPLVFEAISESWPDRDAQTPRYLSGYGAVRALRAGRIGAAARQARAARAWLSPRFLAGAAPLSIRLVRGWVADKAARGVETARPSG